MNLLFPLGLAALASVLVPLALHLARRTEQQPFDFAALLWLRQKPRPRHRPRFDERLLLAVRLLLLAGVALTLAQPVLPGTEGSDAVIAVAPGATVPSSGTARRVWLAPGFPAIDTTPPVGRQPIASLIRELDAQLPAKAPLTIVVPHILDGADAERPRMSRAVTWRIDGRGTAPAAIAMSLRPIVRYDAALPGYRYIAAAVRALGGTDVGALSAVLPSVDDAVDAPAGPALVWLGAGALPTRVNALARAGGIVLVASASTIPAAPSTVIWRDTDGSALVEAQPLGRGRILRFTRPLTPPAMPALLEPDFPRRLAALFAAAPDPGRVPASAYTPVRGAPAPSPPARPLSPWLAVAVAAVFCVERWLATRSTRAPSP
ncbi:hypothetical protein FHT00_000594 [Sphingomonas insulae]|uniref:BatA domain-containing protein n=1 Tax=Sphingomonas insulae TaxID=424800 RepID=A0ABN1HW48_9SPHN|nr:BatA domain-containing protein [Sphingomonas insulae]NIJ28666.1 hypothetical protein [Sphingomonas insulae]